MPDPIHVIATACAPGDPHQRRADKMASVVAADNRIVIALDVERDKPCGSKMLGLYLMDREKAQLATQLIETVKLGHLTEILGAERAAALIVDLAKLGQNL